MVNGLGESSGVDTRGRARVRGGDDSDDSDEADEADVTFEEQRVLDRIAENLARLGRNKRVALTVEDKTRFVEAWKK